jgi:hypothetical protein
MDGNKSAHQVLTLVDQSMMRGFLLGSPIQLMPAGQDLMTQSSMSLRRCDEPDAAMPVFVVVPAYEIAHPNRAASKLAKPSRGHCG